MGLLLADLDNTLLDRAGAFRAWAERFVVKHGLDPSAVQWLEGADEDGQVSRERLFEAVREPFGLTAPIESMVAEYRRDYLSGFRLEPEVANALAMVRAAGWRVIVVTNGPASQRRKIEATGLDALIDGCVVSDDVGVRKPDPHIFREAARLAGALLSGTDWMVGDHPVSDVGGAHAAGMRSIWIRRGRMWSPGEAPPTQAVDTFTEAVERVLAS